MKFSVYNYGSKSYDYYDDGKPSSTHAGAPPYTQLAGTIGKTPEGAAWRLPVGAKKVGSGELPRGRIASLGGISSGSDVVKYGVLAVAAYFAWRHLR